jgi:Glycogen debranching enzyme N terminal
MTIDDRLEWLEADGLAGSHREPAAASGRGDTTRCCFPATTPPTGRLVLVNGFEAWIENSVGRFALTTQQYAPDVLRPPTESRVPLRRRHRRSSVAFRPYDGLPAIVALTNGAYAHAPDWYRNVSDAAEAERGLDSTEDLASPGVFTWRLQRFGRIKSSRSLDCPSCCSTPRAHGASSTRSSDAC